MRSDLQTEVEGGIPPSDSLRCALLGYGWWGRTIAKRSRQARNFEIVAVVDPRPDAAGDIERQGFRAFLDPHDVLGTPDIDAVIIATPHSLHERQVAEAAEAGKHVFCEKPLALTGAGASRAISACRSAGVVLGIGHERRFEPALEALTNLLATGDLGTILHAEADFSHDKLAGASPDNWRVNPAECPAGGMTGGGIHLSDYLISVFGRVRSVSALSMCRHPGDWEVGVTVQLAFEEGMTASIASVLATPFYVRTRVFGTLGHAEVVNTAHPDDPEAFAELCVTRPSGPPQVQNFPSRDTVTANIEAFARAALGVAPYAISLEDINHNTEVLEAVVRSAARQGERQVLFSTVQPEASELA